MSSQKRESMPLRRGLLSGVLLRIASSLVAMGAFVVVPIDVEAQETIRPRVINGDDAPQGAWPWMVALLSAKVADSTEAHFCGGALIGPQHILTAAHCVNKSFPSDTQVLIGETTLPFGPGSRPVVQA